MITTQVPDDDTSGFYKFDGELLYGPNYVINKNYHLTRETKNQFTYPIDGWYWFASEEHARMAFARMGLLP